MCYNSSTVPLNSSAVVNYCELVNIDMQTLFIAVVIIIIIILYVHVYINETLVVQVAVQ